MVAIELDERRVQVAVLCVSLMILDDLSECRHADRAVVVLECTPYLTEESVVGGYVPWLGNLQPGSVSPTFGEGASRAEGRMPSKHAVSLRLRSDDVVHPEGQGQVDDEEGDARHSDRQTAG